MTILVFSREYIRIYILLFSFCVYTFLFCLTVSLLWVATYPQKVSKLLQTALLGTIFCQKFPQSLFAPFAAAHIRTHPETTENSPVVFLHFLPLLFPLTAADMAFTRTEGFDKDFSQKYNAKYFNM